MDLDAVNRCNRHTVYHVADSQGEALRWLNNHRRLPPVVTVVALSPSAFDWS